ncbi:MAG: 23S rRNA (guanosine2251-2'-O)-methyltransferase [Candidatus Azotimanducaceae bacterium]|jgi:23S rRNA (guanosine2251-2'-O)-methyltransferase
MSKQGRGRGASGGTGKRQGRPGGSPGGSAGSSAGGRTGSRPGQRSGPRPGQRSGPPPRRTGGPQGGGREADPRTSGRGLGGKQIEGRQAVRELLMAEKRKIYDIFISADLEGDAGVADIVEIARAQRVMVTYIARVKLDREARSESPQGVLATAAELEEADLGELLRTKNGVKPFLVAVDGVTDPGNLGAIIRNCDGAGVTGVLLPKHRAVHVTPTVAKASAGAIEHVPIALIPGLPATLANMKDHGIWIVGLDDSADRDLFELSALANEPICLVLGAEGGGLSKLVRERCDTIVSIPMMGRISSLNVSAAAALSTYEIARGRRSAS